MYEYDPLIDDRPIGRAILRGLACRCPACGKGRILDGYLKVRDTCAHCHEDLSHQRADDGPAYLTILIVGHLMLPLMAAAFIAYRPEPWQMIALFGSATVVLSLLLLPRMKGLMVAIQWSRRMHGFGESEIVHD
ncbi:MAG: DUF983 domain-containing protein [Rhodobacteraceae bacterium]|nr:DUF983 domain-containing protein [Paracoccaceae bacterium]